MFFFFIISSNMKTFRIWETLNLSTDADRSTYTIFIFWRSNFFFFWRGPTKNFFGWVQHFFMGLNNNHGYTSSVSLWPPGHLLLSRERWQWLTMGNNGWQWLTMADNGWQWLTMADNGWQWLTMAGSGSYSYTNVWVTYSCILWLDWEPP